MTTILEHLERATLVRGVWGDGNKRACLYTALVPGATSTDNCPADVMPQWLADLTPLLDGNVGQDKWRDRVARYGRASLRWHVLDAKAWDRVQRRFRAACIRHALVFVAPLDHGDYWPQVLSVCTCIAETLERGKEPSKSQKAAWAAWAAAWTAAGMAAKEAAWAAAETTAWACDAEEATAWACDALFDALMVLIEVEIAKVAP